MSKHPLQHLQAELHRVLRGEQPCAPLAAAWGVPPERMEIYAAFVAGHVRTVLDKNFACTARLLHAQWRQLADAYFLETPPTHYELNECGRGFPAFLARHAARYAVSPAQLELAELEWLDWDVYRDKAADVPSLPLPAFGDEATFATATQGLAFAANPTLAIVETLYDAHLVLAAHAAHQAADLASEPRPCQVGVYRHPHSRQSAVRALDEIDLLALALAQAQLSLAAAAEATGRPLVELAPLFHEAVARGVVAVVALAAPRVQP